MQRIDCRRQTDFKPKTSTVHSGDDGIVGSVRTQVELGIWSLWRQRWASPPCEAPCLAPLPGSSCVQTAANSWLRPPPRHTHTPGWPSGEKPWQSGPPLLHCLLRGLEDHMAQVAPPVFRVHCPQSRKRSQLETKKEGGVLQLGMRG